MSIFGGSGGSQEFRVILTAEDAGLTGGLRKAGEQMDRTAERVKHLGEAFLVFEGIRKSIDLLKEFNEAAVGKQADQARIMSTLKGQGEGYRGLGNQVTDTLEKMGRLKGFGLDDLTTSFIKVEGATKNHTAALKDLSSVMDFARQRHVDLTSAAQLYTRAAEGNVGSLGRYGIIVPKVTTATDALTRKIAQLTAAHVKMTPALKATIAAQKEQDTVLDKAATGRLAIAALDRANAGAAAAYANTAAGKIATMRATIEQAEANFGSAILPYEIKIVDKAKEWVEQLEHSSRAQADIREAAKDIGNAWDHVVGAVEAVAPILLKIADTAGEITGDIGGAGTLLAITAGWYGAAKAVGVFVEAEKKVRSISALGSAANAAGGSSFLGTPRTLKTVRAAEGASGVEAVASDAGGLAVASGGLRSIEGDAESARGSIADAGAAIKTTEGIAAEAGPGLATFGAGLVEAFNPVTAAIVGVGLLAGAVYLLSQHESDATKAAHGFADSLKTATGLSRDFADASKNVKTDTIQRSLAKDTLNQQGIAIKQTRAQIRTTTDPNTKLILQSDLKQELDQYKLYQANLESAKEAVLGDNARKLADSQKRQQALAASGAKAANVYGDNLAPALRASSNLSRIIGNVGSDPDGNQASAAYTKNTRDAKAYADALKIVHKSLGDVVADAHDYGPAVRATAGALDDYVTKTKKLPSKQAVQFVFEHSKADADIDSVEQLLRRFNRIQVKASVGLTGVTQADAAIQTLIGKLGNIPNQKIITVTQSLRTVLPGGDSSVNRKGYTTAPRTGARPALATGGMTGGAYNRTDSIPVMLTGSEAVLTPTHVSMVDSGWSVMGALQATNAPMLGGAHAAGGLPIVSSNADNTRLTTLGNAQSKGKGATKGSGGTKKTAASAVQAAETAWGTLSTAISNLSGADEQTYAHDQAGSAGRDVLAADVGRLVKDTETQIKRENGAATGRFKSFPTVAAEARAAATASYGTLSGYRSDLHDINHPDAPAPGSDAFLKSQNELQLKLTKLQAYDTAAIPALKTDPKTGKVTNRAAVNKGIAAIKAAKKQEGSVRNKLISSTQQRIAKLKAMRASKKYKRLWSSISDEISQDQQTLYGLIGDRNSQKVDVSSEVTDANQGLTDADNAAAAASTFDNSAFSAQLSSTEATIAGDTAALAAGQVGSAALTTDTQSEFDLVTGRVGQLNAILADPTLNAATRADATAELTQDYGILSGITQGSTGAGGSIAATPNVTADQQAQIDQLTQQLAVQTKTAAVANGNLAAFGSGGDIGTGGYSSAYAAGGYGGAGQQINVYTLHPGDPDTLQAISAAANAGNSLGQFVSNDRSAVNV